jgi:hypothetical protein
MAEIRVRTTAGDNLLWRAGAIEGFDDIQPAGDLLALPQENGCLRYLSFGVDPQLILPDLPRDASAQPLRVDILLMAEKEMGGLVGVLNTGLLDSRPNQISFSGQQLFMVVHKQISDLQNEIVRLRDERDSLAANLTSFDRALDEQRQALRQQISDFRSSYSWRWTRPLRWAAARLLGRPSSDS